MYRIIGGDNQVYGPIGLEQLRAWLADGRVNSQTMVQPEGAADWKPLSAFPEVTAPAAPTVPPPINPPGDKSKVAAGLLGLLLGAWGVHRFYLGYTGIGIAQIVVTILTCGFGGLWGFIEGIMILCGKHITHDAQGRPLKN